jgi:maleate cis-trans isomerase
MAKDWRSLPRKPAHLKKVKRVSIACTESELAKMHEKAKKAGKTLSDYVMDTLLGEDRSSALRS